jgi:hypothetical protein
MRPNVTHCGDMSKKFKKSSKVKTPQAAKRYPYMPFRPSGAMDARVRRLSKESNRSMSWIINRCLEVHLSALEAAKNPKAKQPVTA